MEVGWGDSYQQTSVQGTSSLFQEIFLIPKKEGKTTLEIDVYDSKTSDLVKIIKYEININSDLEVTYKEIK